jgi:hypothetical protein
MQALARLAADGAAAMAIGLPIEGPARLDATQYADQAGLAIPCRRELPGGLLFVDRAGVQIALAVLGFGVLLELLMQDVIGPEQTVHAVGPREPAELALEDEAIQAGQSARDKQGEAL